MKKYIPEKPGLIKTADGITCGQHDGLMYFTLGQRLGIGIGGVKGREQASWYVAHKDQNSNQLVVVQGADNDLLFSEGCYLDEMHWINEKLISESDCEVQIRYQSEPVSAKIIQTKQGYKINFSEPISDVGNFLIILYSI